MPFLPFKSEQNTAILKQRKMLHGAARDLFRSNKTVFSAAEGGKHAQKACGGAGVSHIDLNLFARKRKATMHQDPPLRYFAADPKCAQGMQKGKRIIAKRTALQQGIARSERCKQGGAIENTLGCRHFHGAIFFVVIAGLACVAHIHMITNFQHRVKNYH